jgi:hypothetical protein
MSNADDAIPGEFREIMVMDNFEKTYEIFTTPKIKGGHGGGDLRSGARLLGIGCAAHMLRQDHVRTVRESRFPLAEPAPA